MNFIEKGTELYPLPHTHTHTLCGFPRERVEGALEKASAQIFLGICPGAGVLPFSSGKIPYLGAPQASPALAPVTPLLLGQDISVSGLVGWAVRVEALWPQEPVHTLLIQQLELRRSSETGWLVPQL